MFVERCSGSEPVVTGRLKPMKGRQQTPFPFPPPSQLSCIGQDSRLNGGARLSCRKRSTQYTSRVDRFRVKRSSSGSSGGSISRARETKKETLRVLKSMVGEIQKELETVRELLSSAVFVEGGGESDYDAGE